MVKAVDFDGTIVEHRNPRIGEEIPFAIDTLKLLQQEKHRLILWSVRKERFWTKQLNGVKPEGWNFTQLIRIILKNKKIIRVFPGN